MRLLRPLSLLGLLLATALLSGCGTLVRSPAEVFASVHRPPEAAHLDALHPPGALQADVDFFVATLEAVHPNPYAALSRDAFRAAADALKAGLTAPLTRRAFYTRLAPLVARLQDGHTTLALPVEEVRRHGVAGGRFFPLPLRVEGERLVVRDRLERDALAAGTEVRAVNGEPASVLVRTLRAATAGASTAYRDDRVARFLPYLLFVHYGWTGPFAVETPEEQVTVEGVGLDTLRARSRWSEGQREALVYEPLGDGEAVLRLNSFSGRLDAYERLLETAFARVRADGVERLVLDLRDNGGGDSRLGDALLDYLTDRPYRAVARMEWMRSREYAGYMKRHASPLIRWLPLWGLHPATRGYFRTPVGTVYVQEVEARTPLPTTLRYTGRWAALVGPRTFSSATLFAAIVKDHALAPLAGEETGGQASHFGEVYPFDLPNSRLLATSSVKRFVRPAGDGPPGGVLPDVVVEAARDGGRDPALARALALLRVAPRRRH